MRAFIARILSAAVPLGMAVAVLGLAAPVVASAAAFGPAAGTRDMRRPPPVACKHLLFLSDATAADDQRYTLPALTLYPPFPALPAVDNGWGIWATSDLIFAGEATGVTDKINIYKPCENSLGYSLTTNGAGLFPPESIAVENTNRPVFATEMGSPTVDCGNATILAACSDSDPSFTGTPQYVAIDNIGQVYLSGQDTNGTQQVDQCSFTPNVLTCAPCEVLPNNPSIPGGLAVDSGQRLIVNDQTGWLRSYTTGSGTCGASPISSFQYNPLAGRPTFTFTAITLNQAENAIVVAKEWTSSQALTPCPIAGDVPCMRAKYIYYAAGLIGPFSPLATSPVFLNNAPGTGIAIWPPGAY